MKKFALGLLAAACASALWASDTVRDEFFWLGEMNKATTVINTDEKLLDKRASEILCPWDNRSPPNGCIQ